MRVIGLVGLETKAFEYREGEKGSEFLLWKLGVSTNKTNGWKHKKRSKTHEDVQGFKNRKKSQTESQQQQQQILRHD